MKTTQKSAHEKMEFFEVQPRKSAPAKRCVGTTLHDVYATYSTAKENAFRYCEDLCAMVNGFGMGISSRNCMMFSVMFDFPNPVTGELMRAYITRDHNRAYYL